METFQPAAILETEPKDKDLLKIAELVGTNWEMLGPHLIAENPTTTVDHIKMNHPTTIMRIYHLLLKWRQQAGLDGTFRDLFHQMLKTSPFVTVEWSIIAKYLKITEKEIRACKDDRQPRAQVSSMESMPDGEAPDGQVIYESGQSMSEQNLTYTDGPSLETKLENKTSRPPRIACLFDGRLLKLEPRDIELLETQCTDLIGEGGFGKVYASKKSLDGFGMRVAVKKCKGNDPSVRRERFASRIMHPFILPLLAVVDKDPHIRFISPYFEGGDLHSMIERDRNVPDIKMNHVTRLKILLQIAMAIQYIHTNVEDVREVILHKDICSKNVVLDGYYNARLIDFGLAREKTDKTSNVKGGKSVYQHPDVGKEGKHATETWDYYAYRVVIREMLTGLPPDGRDGTFLKYMSATKIIENLQVSVWPHENPTYERAIKLNEIAGDDLSTDNWNPTDFRRKTDAINVIWRDCLMRKLLDLPDTHKRCHICIINPAAEELSMNQDHVGCTQKIKVCIACERNSFLNPITCFCGTALKPGIGSRWGALLVAGNDASNDSLANALTEDVKELKKIITSKAPCIMGISEKNVRIVVPAKPGKPKSGTEPENLWPEVRSKLKEIRQLDIDTLLVYFSCHGAKGNGSGDGNGKNRFELASKEDCISLQEFTTELNNLENVEKLIVFLDRCYAPMVPNVGKKLLQINACKENEPAEFNDRGSIFTKYIIQGLKAQSENTCSDKCHYCIDYKAKQDNFISAPSLFDYVKKHMENKKQTPEIKMESDVSHVAYYTDERVKIDFTSIGDGNLEKVVPLEYFQTMRQLEKKLLTDFGKNQNLNVVIKKKTYRKRDQEYEECRSLEQVMSAWVNRHPLYVSFQNK